MSPKLKPGMIELLRIDNSYRPTEAMMSALHRAAVSMTGTIRLDDSLNEGAKNALLFSLRSHQYCSAGEFTRIMPLGLAEVYINKAINRESGNYIYIPDANYLQEALGHIRDHNHTKGMQIKRIPTT